jgi:hypothetical protein
MSAHRKYHGVVLMILLALSAACLSGRGIAEEDLQQDPIVIKGSQSLPKTLYIAPWKRVGAPLDMQAPELNIGEAHEPIEPDLFQQELELKRSGYGTDSPISREAANTDADSATNRP